MAETITPPAQFNQGAAVPSTDLTGLTSRQVMFGSPSGGVAQDANLQWDSTALRLLGGSSQTTGIPAGRGVGFQLQGTLPFISLIDAAQGADARAWEVVPSGGALFFQANKDDGSGNNAFFKAVRTTGLISNVSLLTSASNQALFVNSSGHVGFGTTSPNAVINIVAQVNNSSSPGFTLDVLTRSSADQAFLFTGAAAGREITMFPDGRLGVGTTAPTARLHSRTTVNGNAFQVTGTTGGATDIFVCESTGSTSKIGFFGVAPTTKAAAYTTAAITTARVFPTTAGISTFTGVSGAGACFTSRADLEALVRVVDSIWRDLNEKGLLG